MSLHLFVEYMSYIQIWRMWLFKFSWRYQSIFVMVSHYHENKMFHDGVTTFSWQCWALTKVIYFVVVHSFSWRVRAPTKLDFVAAIHSHENIYSCVFWTATNYFHVVFPWNCAAMNWVWKTWRRSILEEVAGRHEKGTCWLTPRKLYFHGVRFVRVIAWWVAVTEQFRGGIDHSFRDGSSLSRKYLFLGVILHKLYDYSSCWVVQYLVKVYSWSSVRILAQRVYIWLPQVEGI